MEVQATRDTGFLDFEKTYINLRQKENRIAADEELAILPKAPTSHPHYYEWKSRKGSSERLIKYLKEKKLPLKILEVGCGNGWLSHKLSKIPRSKVMGADINSFELEQAKRVFGKKPNLEFFYGDINDPGLAENKYDVIVFAASLQYFASLSTIINSATSRLHQEGEIHILDTHLYEPGEIPGAKQRSAEYFNRLGFPELSSYYYHHDISELQHFSHRILYKPRRFVGIFPLQANPFLWICINGKRP